MSRRRPFRIAGIALLAIGFCAFERGAQASEAKPGAKPSVKSGKPTAKPASYETAFRGSNYLASKRVLQDVVRANRPKEPGAAEEWTRSLLALVSLERLIGDEAEARKQFARCDSLCPAQVSEEEWRSIKEWACNGTKSPVAACKLRKK